MHPLFDPTLDRDPWRPRPRRLVLLCPLAAVAERRPRIAVVVVRAHGRRGWWAGVWALIEEAITGLILDDWRDA